jgi:hypothetical protein
LLCEFHGRRNQPFTLWQTRGARDRSAACPSRDAAPRHRCCRGRGPDPGGERLHRRWLSAAAHSRRRAGPLRECGGGAVDVLFGGRLQDCAFAARRHGRRVDHPGCQAGQSRSLSALAHRSPSAHPRCKAGSSAPPCGHRCPALQRGWADGAVREGAECGLQCRVCLAARVGRRSPRMTPCDRVRYAAFGAGNGVGKAEAGRR